MRGKQVPIIWIYLSQTFLEFAIEGHLWNFNYLYLWNLLRLFIPIKSVRCFFFFLQYYESLEFQFLFFFFSFNFSVQNSNFNEMFTLKSCIFQALCLQVGKYEANYEWKLLLNRSLNTITKHINFYCTPREFFIHSVIILNCAFITFWYFKGFR